MDICFGDLVKVNGWWEVAFKSDGKVVVVITPPYPMMDGSGFPGFRAVGIGRVETHYSIAAVPGAIEALQQIASGKLIVEGEERDAPESLQKTLGVNAQRVKDIYLVGPDNSALFAVIAVRMASDALRAVRGEESA